MPKYKLTLNLIILLICIDLATSSCPPYQYAPDPLDPFTCTYCHPSCYQCSGPTKNDCVSCDMSSSTRISGGSSCPCVDGFYDPISGASYQCSPCDGKCKTCQDYNNQCTGCDTTMQRTLNTTSKKCQCVDGYYDSGVVMCANCHETCTKCSTAGVNGCTDCDSASFRVLVGSSCKCMTGYYSVGSNVVCSQCDMNCLTCETTSTNCLTCDPTRQLDTATKTCICKDGYGENSPISAQCQSLICDPKCKTCRYSSSTCTSCDSSTQFRTLDSINSQCLCLTKYFEKNSLPICQSCHYSCLTCQTVSTKCTSCDTSLMRTYNSSVNTCSCNDKFYDSGAAMCQPCHYSCNLCAGSGLSTGCTSCDSAKYRTSDGSGACTCMDKYFDTGSTETCSSCDVRCLTCQAQNTNCTTCHSSRQLDSSTKMCTCIDGYAENSPVTQSCRQLVCDVSCLTCKTVENFCASCVSTNFRTLNSGLGQCNCNQKYYDTGVAQCQSCHYSCKTCSVLSTNCTSCNVVKFRVPDGAGNCSCMDKYFNSGTNELCSACSYKCKTCETSSTNCLTCGDNRNTAPLCACLDGFYDDGMTEACLACHYSCKTCISASACASCDGTIAFRGLTSSSNYCVCLARYYEPAPNTLICTSCHPTCFTCTSSNANTACTSCLSTANRLLSGSTCVCKTGFYSTDPNTELCSACDYTCKTCSVSSTNCTSCSSSLFRVISGNTCPCMDGYFQSPQTGLCTACHSSCKTCTNATECLTCDTVTKLYALNSSNLCSCPSTQYFNTTQNKCINCAITCKTCTQTSGTACTSCDTGRSLVSGACLCLPYYYSNGAICSACHYSCKTCSGVLITNCLTCSSTNYRSTTLSGGKCLCMTGYFDDGANMLCKKCSYQCATCVDATSCASCDATKLRSSPASLCPCMTGYYETSSLTCAKCAYYCVTCTQASICTTCNSPNRYLNPLTLKCDCPDKFYDDGSTITCKACLPECKTCTNGTKCSSCQIADYRNLTSGNRCPCIDKYYDNAGTCTSCQYFCTTCSDGVTCDTCNTTANRVLDSATKLCLCKTGFYDNGVEDCEPCDYTCTTCTASATQCTSCDASRTLTAQNQCLCKNKSYQNGVPACPNCQYTCSACTNATACSSCNLSKFRTFDSLNVRCTCLDKYFDDGTNELCASCSYKCKTCTNATQCLTCDATKFRITPASLCPCMPKFYDSGTNSETCLSCHYSCATCTNATECQTCESTTNKRNLDSATKLCKCVDKFYDDGSNEQCLPCVYSCATCQTSSDHCLTCDLTTHRELLNNACSCKKRFYDGNLDEVCETCQYSCETCSDATTCDTCDILKFRQHNSTDDLCHCITGYYDDLTNNETCQQCHPSCVQCTDGVSCSSCDTSKKMLLNSSVVYNGSVSHFCVCEYGHYSTGYTQTCLPCHYTCEVCSGPNSNNCLFCDSSANRILKNLNQCQCKSGFYEDTVNELCPQCHDYCATCSGPLSTQCFTCKPTRFSLLNQTTCFVTCPDYYFNNIKGMKCTLCDTHCLHCTNETTCTECETGYHLLLLDNKCYLNCPDGYWENSSNKLCTFCPLGCKTCDSMIKCFHCIDHFYFDQQASMCYSCHETCKSCIGPAQDQCLSCYEPLYFKTNKCRNLTCPYGQYVDSILGCKSCSDLFSNSLTCNKTRAFLCTATYKLKNGACKVCSEVEGYHITSSTNTCSELCGDGKLFDYQCDDGNQLDGDGCSKNCIIEEGWSCKANSTGSTSVCKLESTLSMKLNKLVKASGKNTVTLYFTLSLPYRLVNKFSVTADGVLSSEITWKHSQNDEKLSSVELQINYTKSLQGKNLQLGYNSTLANRRLQQTNQVSHEQSFYQVRALQASSSITFDTQLQLTTFPPVNYYSPTEFQFFDTAKTVIRYLAIVLLAVSIFIFPTKTHLHSFTFSFIVAKVWLMFGLGLEEKLDWVNFVLHDIKPFALIGGVSMGDCCHNMSSFYEYSSELVSNSLFVLLTWGAVWVVLGVVHLINRFCKKMPGLVQFTNYHALTIHLVLSFQIFYGSLNALHHYSIENKIDAFNTSLSIAVSIFSLFLLIGVWILTVYLQMQRSTPGEIAKKVVDEKKQENIFERKSTNEDNESQVQSLQTSEVMQRLNSEQNQNYSEIHFSGSHRVFIENKVLKVSSLENQSLGQLNNMTEFLIEDYKSLYHKQRAGAKYFLPVTLTFLYIQAALIVFLASYDKFNFIIVEGCIELIYLLYMVIQRPFASMFTNLRICLISLLFMGMQGTYAYYLYLEKRLEYLQIAEIVNICLIGLIFVLAIAFCLLENVLSWRREIGECVRSYLKMFEWKTEKKVHDAPIVYVEKESQEEIQVEQINEKNSESEQMDAFYARILKKESLNKKYRRERKLKEGIYHAY